jgi:dihydrolipoamide dehydrogenase
MTLGCHVVGERAVETVQLVAVAMVGGMRVDELARVPLSFPTYAGILGRAAVDPPGSSTSRSAGRAPEPLIHGIQRVPAGAVVRAVPAGAAA